MGWDLCCRWSHRISIYFIALHHITLYHTTLFRSISTLYMYTKISQVSKYVGCPRPSHRLEGAQRRPTRTAQLISSTRFESSQIVYWLTNQAQFRYITLHHITSHYVTSRHNSLFQIFYSEDPPCPTPLHLISSHLMFPPLHFISLLLFLLNLTVQPKLLPARLPHNLWHASHHMHPSPPFLSLPLLSVLVTVHVHALKVQGLHLLGQPSHTAERLQVWLTCYRL